MAIASARTMSSAFPKRVGGRYRGRNRPPFAGVARYSLEVFESGMSGTGRPFATTVRQRLDQDAGRRRLRFLLGALLVVAAAGWIRMSLWDEAARRFLILPAVAGLMYVVSRLVFPYLYFPARYVVYTVPPVAYVVLASGAAGLWPVGRIDRRWARWLGAIPGAVAVLLLGGRGSPEVGLDRLAASTGGGYAAIRALPERALLAGWPSGMVNFAPWITGRPALVTFETHQALHEGYVLEMRRRTEAVIEAFYGCDSRPLLRLRDEFGVSHFVVDLELARTRSAEYFAPFDLEIRRARENCWGGSWRFSSSVIRRRSTRMRRSRSWT